MSSSSIGVAISTSSSSSSSAVAGATPTSGSSTDAVGLRFHERQRFIIQCEHQHIIQLQQSCGQLYICRCFLERQHLVCDLDIRGSRSNTDFSCRGRLLEWSTFELLEISFGLHLSDTSGIIIFILFDRQRLAVGGPVSSGDFQFIIESYWNFPSTSFKNLCNVEWQQFEPSAAQRNNLAILFFSFPQFNIGFLIENWQYFLSPETFDISHPCYGYALYQVYNANSWSSDVQPVIKDRTSIKGVRDDVEWRDVRPSAFKQKILDHCIDWQLGHGREVWDHIVKHTCDDTRQGGVYSASPIVRGDVIFTKVIIIVCDHTLRPNQHFQTNTDRKCLVVENVFRQFNFQRNARLSRRPSEPGYGSRKTVEWVTLRQGVGATLTLSWPFPMQIAKVTLADRPNSRDNILGGTLTFGDAAGQVVNVPQLPNDGTPLSITFNPITTKSLVFRVSSVSATSTNIGLSELSVFSLALSTTAAGTGPVNWARYATAVANTATKGQSAAKAVDGISLAGKPTGDSFSQWNSSRGGAGASLQLSWATPVTLASISLFDQPDAQNRITGSTITFNTGDFIRIPALRGNGTASIFNFSPVTVTSLNLTITSVARGATWVGLAELQSFTLP
ncbi:hypothetical protein RQP46_006800 [Phenoliferia psychrophenolica]